MKDLTVTLKELSQLFYLNKEIEKDEERLQALREKLKRYQRHGQCSSELKMLIHEQQELISAKQKRAYIEQNRLYRFINSVEDSLMRQILIYRFVNGKTWQEVARCIGEYDESYVRRKCMTFLQNLPKMSENL